MRAKLLSSAVGIAGIFAVSVAAFAKSLDMPAPKEAVQIVKVLQPPDIMVCSPSVGNGSVGPENIMGHLDLDPAATATPGPEKKPVLSKIKSKDKDTGDAYLLAKIAMAEAEDQDVQGKALVILVVLNRVNDDRFPDTVKEVIYQPKQFSPVANGRFGRVEPDAGCWEALDMVQSGGWDKSKGALYFESKSKSTWHGENLQFLFKHGEHYFYKERGEGN